MPTKFTNDTMVRVAHADVEFCMAFTQTLGFWREQFDPAKSQTARVTDSLGMGRILIEGACESNVKLPFGGLVLIDGDLSSTIHVGVYAEVVIAGDILQTGVIKSSGICNVFVGGNCRGKIMNSGTSNIWIESTFSGVIRTGVPSGQIHIGNNYNGHIRPLRSAGLLWLVVGGFMPQTALRKIADHHYTQFNASIAKSDIDVGIYPTNREQSSLMDRWCVGEQCLAPSSD